jgi:ligand-binding sensor protein
LSKKIKITDLIGINELQVLQDSFAKSNSIASTITNINGNPITKPSNHCKVCTLVRQTSKGLNNCILSGKNLGRESLKHNQPCYHKCQSVGFFDASAPILINDVHIANWLIGQNCIGDVDENHIADYANEIGADKDKMLKAFSAMYKITENEFTKKLDFLSVMANQLSQLAYQSFKNDLIVKKLKISNEELKKYKKQLEEIVEDKTTELKILKGLLPICCHCKKIRDDKGYWNQIESYIHEHSEAKFSHGICQECAKKLYPDVAIYDENGLL